MINISLHIVDRIAGSPMQDFLEQLVIPERNKAMSIMY
jgi:hypothetical protein